MNRLFLTAVLGEMCMEYTVNLKVGRYSPFKLFKQEMNKEGLQFTGNKITCIVSALNLQQLNGMEPHTLAVKALGKMLSSNEINTIYSNIETRALTTVFK